MYRALEKVAYSIYYKIGKSNRYLGVIVKKIFPIVSA